MTEGGNITVLTDAKEEYTKRLISILKPCIYQGIRSIYSDAKDICNQDNTPENVLMTFQDLLSRIPKWSQDIINNEFQRISDVSKCDYLDDLIKVVYVCHIKILTIVHNTQKNKKITLKIPSGSHFIHLCYIESAREFWKDPYLFSENASKYELQKNMRDSENMIGECVYETMRKLLPVRYILKELLNDVDEEIEEEDEDVKETVNKKYMKRLETIIKKELKNVNSNDNNGNNSNNGNNGNNFDLEIIRKVIREEISNHPNTSNTNNNTIKKELLDNMIEKIVEKSHINTNSDNSTTSATTSATSATTSATTSAASANNPKTDNVSTSENTVSLDNNPIMDNVSTQDNKPKKDNISISDNKAVPDEVSKEENVNNKLEDLINDIENNDEKTNLKSDKKELREQDDIVVDNNIPNMPKQKKILEINNIEEINLNLDELDNDFSNDVPVTDTDNVTVNDGISEVDGLEEVELSNIKPSGKDNKKDNEIKNETNTKYIFFKDAK